MQGYRMFTLVLLLSLTALYLDMQFAMPYLSKHKLDKGLQKFTEEDFVSSNKEHVFLFFHAKWCPTCLSLEKNIYDSRFQIPENVAIFQVDFDDSQELKERYGVLVQTTVVQLNSRHQFVAKWAGSRSLQDILDSMTHV